MLPQAVKPAAPPDLLSRLGSLCADRGLEALADRLQGLLEVVGTDMESVEERLREVACPDNLVGRSADHLLDLGGKRLRPMCVALASRVGSGFTAAGLDLAVAVELVHSATLLHDDVVDLADTRRGRSTARTEYGNAASIFAGDWLLVEALRRVRRSEVPMALDTLLDTIDEMIQAESVQLESRGKIDTGRTTYFHVAEGKTAALFRWAMYAGGKAGGLDEAACASLEAYGLHLGVAFQVIDDLLDLTGETAQTGKSLFGDLREGKMTYPLILALERDRYLRPALEEILSAGDEGLPAPLLPAPLLPAALCARVIASLHDTGAVEDCRTLARERSARAIEALTGLPASPATTALATVAEATVNRRS